MQIATHNGQFQADEVLACAILTFIYPDAKIVRTRDPNIYNMCDYVVDVGKEYDPARCRFDHHFETKYYFNAATTAEHTTSMIPLSAVGMVYKEVGRRFWQFFVEKTLPELNSTTLDSDEQLELELLRHETLDQAIFDVLYNNLYYQVLREIDAVDNGIFNATSKNVYPIYNTFSSLISKFNRFDHSCMGDAQDAAFLEAMDWARRALMAIMTNMLVKEHTFHAKQSMFVNTAEVLCDGRVVLFNSGQIKGIETRLLEKLSANPLYIAYRETVPGKQEEDYVLKTYRSDAPKLNSSQFSNIAYFIHHNGFIAKMSSRENFNLFLDRLF